MANARPTAGLQITIILSPTVYEFVSKTARGKEKKNPVITVRKIILLYRETLPAGDTKLRIIIVFYDVLRQI